MPLASSPRRPTPPKPPITDSLPLEELNHLYETLSPEERDELLQCLLAADLCTEALLREEKKRGRGVHVMANHPVGRGPHHDPTEDLPNPGRAFRHSSPEVPLTCGL